MHSRALKPLSYAFELQMMSITPAIKAHVLTCSELKDTYMLA